MSAANLSHDELSLAESKFSNFLEGTLRPSLASAVADEGRISDEASEYRKVKEAIEMEVGKEGVVIKDAVLTENLRCKARIVPNTVYVNVGFGVVVEFRFPEALEFIEGKLVLLEDKRKLKAAKVAEIRSHIEEVLVSLTLLRNPQDLR